MAYIQLFRRRFSGAVIELIIQIFAITEYGKTALDCFALQRCKKSFFAEITAFAGICGDLRNCQRIKPYSRTFQFTEGLAEGMKVTAHYFTEETSDDLTDIMETIKEGPAILEGLVEKAEKIKADSILVQDTKPLPEDNCDIWFDTSEDDFFAIENMELTSVEGVALVQRISEVGNRLDTLEQMNYIIRPNGVDDTHNIQRLLDNPSIKTITFTPGTFYISEELQIGSDVTLKLQPNTILKKLPSHVGNIIVNKNIYATGYTGNENITIDGGIFDFSNVGSGDSIFFLHCENVSVKNGSIEKSCRNGFSNDII